MGDVDAGLTPEMLKAQVEAMEAAEKEKERQMIEEIVKTAEEAYRKVQEPELLEIKDSQKRVEKMHELFPHFAKMFPLVIRYMTELGLYNSNVLRKWLTGVRGRHVPQTATTKRSEREQEELAIEDNARFVVDMYKWRNPHYKTNEVKQIKEDAIKSFTKEYEELNKLQNEYKNRKKELDDATTNRRRAEILLMIDNPDL